MRYVIELERDLEGRPVGRVASDSMEPGREFKGWFELLSILGDGDVTGASGDPGLLEMPPNVAGSRPIEG